MQPNFCLCCLISESDNTGILYWNVHPQTPALFNALCLIHFNVVSTFPSWLTNNLHPGKLTWNPKSWRFGSDDFPFQIWWFLGSLSPFRRSHPFWLRDRHPEDPAATVHEAHVLDFQTPPGPQRQGTCCVKVMSRWLVAMVELFPNIQKYVYNWRLPGCGMYANKKSEPDWYLAHLGALDAYDIWSDPIPAMKNLSNEFKWYFPQQEIIRQHPATSFMKHLHRCRH